MALALPARRRRRCHWSGLVAVVAALALLSGRVSARADEAGGQDGATKAPQPITLVEETLGNGLRVVYAPMKTGAPVVHMRVLYHVGSRDERPDRQGFAHMFEHMMFRGSAHVKPEEHMKLIGVVGGISNAFTSFDETVYVNTIPSNHLEMALYLEADRMASFKVDENIYKTERKVVGEEWRLRQNRPYGTQFEDFLKVAFTTHPYRWTPIGNMEDLAAAGVQELQAFFNRYYVPNNAILVIAGNFDVEQTKPLVKKYFGWIPKGQGEVRRDIPKEPEQTEARRAEVKYPVPLPAVMVGYKLPPYKSDDHYALDLLASILGGGRSARLDQRLVHGANPIAVNAGAGHTQLEDAGVFTVSATLLRGKGPAEAEKALVEEVAKVVDQGVTAEELAKAKTQTRIALIHGRETATSLADQVGDAALFGDDASRVNTDLARYESVTPADVRRVAKQYLEPKRSTTLTVVPESAAARVPGVAKADAPQEQAVKKIENAPVADVPVAAAPRVVKFPPGYPEHPPMADANVKATFDKGVESTVNGVKVIVLSDHRLPVVSWSLTMRRGSHSDPKGKDGLASIAGDMLRRGAAGLSFEQLNRDLEQRGLSLEVGDGGDFTRVGGSGLSADLEHGVERTRQILREPTFPPEEFAKLKNQILSSLLRQRETPSFVAGQDLTAALFGDTPLGRNPTPETVSAITLDDVKQFAKTYFRPNDAILVFSGDVTPEKGQELANKLLDGWESGPLPTVDYTLPPAPAKRRIVLVDNPAGKQATIRMGIRAYTNHAEEKFPGAVAGQILTAGIDSRLGRYVRAEKGLAYGVTGIFRPGRHAGEFVASTDTAIETTADAVEAIWKVLNDMRGENVTPQELADAQRRVAGGMVMGMQTAQQQAGYRVDVQLNDYPSDYYDVYPQRIAEVTPEQVRNVMQKYVKDGEMAVIVVAPADKVKQQLERLGDVEVIPMPAKRDAAAGQPTNAPAKKAA